jgi:hypothetical protein
VPVYDGSPIQRDSLCRGSPYIVVPLYSEVPMQASQAVPSEHAWPARYSQSDVGVDVTRSTSQNEIMWDENRFPIKGGL